MTDLTRIRLALTALAALLAGCAGLPPQQDHVARNGLLVYERADGAFEVFAKPGTAGPQYFCAAGDFARVRRNAGATDRVVMTRPDAPSIHAPGRRSAVFDITPPGPRTLPLVTTAPMNRAGASMTVAGAQNLCKRTRNTPQTF